MTTTSFLPCVFSCLSCVQYHLLMEEFKDSPLVDMYHMSLKENDDGSDVIFLYRFIRGVCPSSFGGKVAKAAGLPEEVLKLSGVMSKQLEARCVAAHQTASVQQT